MDGLEPVEYVYNSLGQLETVIDGYYTEQRVTQIAYNSEGYAESITDPILRKTSFEYDAAGRIIMQTLHDGKQVKYTYDKNGNTTSITPPGSSTHYFNYTPINRQEDYTPPNVGAGTNDTHYDYNLDGQLELITRPDGKTIDLEYGAVGRLYNVFTPRGTTHLSYNSDTSKLAAITTPEGDVVSYTWDGMFLNDTIWVGQVSGSVKRIYDPPLLQLWSLTISDTHTIVFSYDWDGLIISAGDLSMQRDPLNGLLIGSELVNINTNYGYNGFAELVDYKTSFNDVTIFDVEYTRDNLGRIMEKIETIDQVNTTFSYFYDPVGKLNTVQRDEVTISTYEYDPNGNRLSHTDKNGLVTIGTYDNQDRMLAYGNTTYTYTANGELLTKTDEGQTTTYTYDVMGNLTDVYLPDGTYVHYVIDGLNRRVGKEINGSLVQGFLYKDQINPLAELDAYGNILSIFVYGCCSNIPDYMITNGNTYRIITDHLGSPRLVIDSDTGEILQQMEYDELGNVLQDTNPGLQPFGFAGGIYERATGLVRFGVRDYDPESGRWTTKDPIDFYSGETNFYGYCLNDPINSIDPNGIVSQLIINFIKFVVKKVATRLSKKILKDELNAGEDEFIKEKSGDTDGDGIPDFRDGDIDDDGIFNWDDSDIDGDGIINEFDTDPYWYDYFDEVCEEE